MQSCIFSVISQHNMYHLSLSDIIMMFLQGTGRSHLNAKDISYSILLPLGQCRVNNLPNSWSNGTLQCVHSLYGYHGNPLLLPSYQVSITCGRLCTGVEWEVPQASICLEAGASETRMSQISFISLSLFLFWSFSEFSCSSVEEKGRMVHIPRQSIQEQISFYDGIRSSVLLSPSHTGTFSGSFFPITHKPDGIIIKNGWQFTGFGWQWGHYVYCTANHSSKMQSLFHSIEKFNDDI